VARLQVHLPRQNLVYFPEDLQLQRMAEANLHK
jgi:hypothetical protein